MRHTKIRDDEGYWQQIEGFIAEHSDAKFSHGICPECMEKLYPDEYQAIKSGKAQQALSADPRTERLKANVGRM